MAHRRALARSLFQSVSQQSARSPAPPLLSLHFSTPYLRPSQVSHMAGNVCRRSYSLSLSLLLFSCRILLFLLLLLIRCCCCWFGFEAPVMGRLCGPRGQGGRLGHHITVRVPIHVVCGVYACVCVCASVFVLNSTKLKSFVCTMNDFNICSLYSPLDFPADGM